MWPIYLFVGLFFCLSEIQCSEGRAEYLLPGDVKPYHYDVKAVYDIDPSTNFSYFGVVDILITANAPTSKIVLHSQGFTVNTEKTSLKSESGAITIQDVKLEDKYNLLVLTLGSNLVKNENYTLTIPFSGNLKKDLDGVYISTYVNKMTSPPISEYLVTTQFEAISARKGFPCFDEPMYKATFTVTLGHHRDYSAVSNMPQALSGQESPFEDIWSWNEVGARFNKDKSKFLWDRFEKSVPMSTYLVAFVISKFGYVESPSDLSTSKFKIWARRDALQQTTYASIVGPKVLTIFEKWFNVPFPLPKQDMMAIPDFSAGAMENWGLITYRETALLYDKKQSSLTAKERVAEVIAHELAHQWFGNLVTMKWWSDLWLNEGFATFVGSLGVRGVEPSWQSAENNAVSNARSVLALDALETSHPVSAPIDDPKRIYEIFDEISYKKGANLIRMMTMFLGEDVFRKAITNYLLKYSYKNAEQDDLWQELTEVTQTYNVLSRNVTVKEIMDTWTKQTGYPLLTVKRDYTDNTLTIMQKRYLSLGAKSKTSVSWWVPLNVLCEHEVGKKLPEPIQWLSNKEGTDHEFKFDHDAQNNQWILFNADMIGLYRVNYDQRNWDLLIKTLNSDKYQNIPTLNRVQLLEDAFALSWSGVIDYSTTLKVPYPKSAQRDSITKAPLSVCLKAVSFEPYVLSPEKVTSHLKVDISLLVNYLSQETELLPIETALSALSKIENVLLRAPEYGAFQKFVRKLITNAYQSSGGLYKRAIVNSDDLRSVTLQVLLSRWACRMNVHGCEQNAISLFQEWMEVDNPDEENPIPLDLRSTVYCVAISRGSVEEWKFLFQRYQNSNVASAKISAMLALSCTREVWILKQFLEWTIDSGTEVRTQDAGSVITSIARTSVGYYLVKDFLYNRIEEIHKAFFGQSRRLGHVVKAVAEQFTSQKDLDEFLAWRDRNQKYLEETKLAISQAVEKAQVNIGWLSRNQNVVVNKMREFTSLL